MKQFVKFKAEISFGLSKKKKKKKKKNEEVPEELKSRRFQSLSSCLSTLSAILPHMSHLVIKPTKCAQRRLRSAWASAQSDQSSLCAQWIAKDSSFIHADSEDSDQMRR